MIQPKTKRPIGLAKDKLKITKSLFKPLPDDLLDAFEGIGTVSPRLSKKPAQ
jgi:hypothetical protein